MLIVPPFTARFQEAPLPAFNVPHVLVTVDGKPYGDPLNDNALEEDFFRYHDPLHFSLLALAGWSPVTFHHLAKIGFALPSTYPRERVIEEGLVASLFALAKHEGFLQNTKILPPAIYHYLRGATYSTPLAQLSQETWLEILQPSYKVFLKLAQNRGGELLVDQAQHVLQLL